MADSRVAFVFRVADRLLCRCWWPEEVHRKLLEALRYFTIRNIVWRALPNGLAPETVWKRFWRLSRSGGFEAFFQALAQRGPTAIVRQNDSPCALGY